MMTFEADCSRSAVSSELISVWVRCRSASEAAADMVEVPHPPKITLVSERFIALHMM